MLDYRRRPAAASQRPSDQRVWRISNVPARRRAERVGHHSHHWPPL